MSKKNIPDTSRSSEVKGILLQREENAFRLCVKDLPAVDHLFYANHFQLGLENGQLIIVFGSVSHFLTGTHYRLAVEIAVPIRSAKESLVSSIWDRPGSNGNTPFIKTLESEVTQVIYSSTTNATLTSETEFKLPEDPNCYRSFAANFATSTTTIGQTLIEFLEIPPDLLVALFQNAGIREGTRIRSILGVLMSPAVALDFFSKTRMFLSKFEGLEAAVD